MTRVALYSHDTMGLGHVRRNLLIAQALACSSWRASVLMITGVHIVGAFKMPPGVDCLSLPALCKKGDGQYQSRRLPMLLEELIDVRAKTIRAALTAFRPNVLLVDNVPRGAMRELDLSLECLRENGETRCVLGLRDILDEPAVVYHQWCCAENKDAIRRFYDAIWVYCDPSVCDPAQEYAFPADIAAKVHYTGYLDQRRRLDMAENKGENPLKALNLLSGRLVLCLVGGGEDGELLAEVFAHTQLPAGFVGVILTGPFMLRGVQQRLQHIAAQRPDLHVLDFFAEPCALVSRADRIIAMGGYNTTCEVLSFGKRALIVPRVHPRREQLIRAERLRDLGLVDMLHPDRLNPDALGRWLATDLLPPEQVHERIDLDGFKRLPGLLGEVLSASRLSFPAIADVGLSYARRLEDRYVAHMRRLRIEALPSLL